MSGKTIKLFLVDGNSLGLSTVEVINWTGKALSFPRTKLPDLAARAESRKPGIYILAGEDAENPLQEIIYIGESDNVLKRLKQHDTNTENEFWTRTLIFISKDENLTKSHIKYLEAKLIQLANEAQRAKVQNRTSHEYLILPDSDIADMDYFLEQIKLLLPVLGFTFALPLARLSRNIAASDQTPDIQVDSPLFKMTYGGAEAYAKEINNEFIVFKDSTIKADDTESLRFATREKKRLLLFEGKLILHPSGSLLQLLDNIAFKTPSGAAAFVGGTSLNGRLTWKNAENNLSYQDWQNLRISEIDTGESEESGEDTY